MKNLGYFALILSYLILSVFFLYSYRKKEGCTDPDALNYDQSAKRDCCCEYNGSISFYTRTGSQLGGLFTSIDGGDTTELTDGWIAQDDPSCEGSFRLTHTSAMRQVTPLLRALLLLPGIAV